MMTLMSILATSDNGNYFSNVAQTCSMSAGDAKAALERLCPAIAAKLKAKAASDNNKFEALLDLLDEGVDLNGLTDGEAIADGTAVLDDLYGSPAAALAEMKKLAPGLDDSQYENISAIAATSVLAVLVKSYATPATLASSAGEAPQGGGILSTIIYAILKGLLQGARSQLAPRRRRLYQLLRHAAQNHTPQAARQNPDAGRYFRTNPDRQIITGGRHGSFRNRPSIRP